MKISLGVNIDHVATLRNARGEGDPSLVEMALEAQEGGADSFTMHLREDRRHIKDEDLWEVRKHTLLPINLEMALTDEMVKIAVDYRPGSVCIVPEKREEVTTEGGLDLLYHSQKIKEVVPLLKENNIRIFLFIEPDINIIGLAADLGVHGVEVHTGAYARSFKSPIEADHELQRIRACASTCHEKGLEFHAGHGLNYHNVYPLKAITNLTEVNIGHAIIARSIKVGLKKAVKAMKECLQ